MRGLWITATLKSVPRIPPLLPRMFILIWWMMTACGVIVLLFGWVTTTGWAQRSTSKVASLFHGAETTPAK